MSRRDDALSFLDAKAADALATDQAQPWPTIPGEVADYLTTPPPALQWFARDRLLADRAHLLTGIGGSSKTRLLYHLGIGAVTGRLPWDWTIARTGAAVLFLAEDSPGGVHRTLAAIVEHAGLTAAELALLSERLRVYPLAGHDAKLLALIPGGGLVETSNARGLLETCKRIPGLVFVGLDPALGLTDGDENNQSHQRRLGELADRIALELGVCVVMASHAAKALQSAEEVASHSSRGGGAITDAVRGEYVLRTMTAPEARRVGIEDIETRKAHVQLVATKGNDLPPEAYLPTWLIRGPGGVLSQVFLEEANASSNPIGKRELDALAILKDMTQTGAVRVGEWRQSCIKRGLISGSDAATEKHIHRIKHALLSAGLIEPGTGKGVFLPVSEASK